MLIIRNLVRRRTRTLLTLIGISIGIATIVALTAMVEALLTNFGAALTSSAADLAIQPKQESGAAMTTGGGLDERYGDELLEMPDVRAVAGMLYTIVPLPGAPYFVVFGHEPERFAMQRFKIIDGETLPTRSGGFRGRPMILGKVASENLNKGIGDTIHIHESTYRIIGLYETGSVMEDGGAVVSLADAQRIANLPDQVTNLWVQLKRPDRAEQILARLQRRYPDLEVLRASEGGLPDYYATYMRPFGWGLALIAALVGGVGMMNASLMSVFERTREIGVLRAVGWRRRQVILLVLGESLVLSIVGGISGAALGAVLVKAATRSPALSGLMGGTLDAGSYVRALGSVLVMGLVGGGYPAWRASRLVPAEALRYEGASGSARRGPTRAGMALRNLFRQGTRTALTLLGVGIGVFALTAVSSLVEGAMGQLGAMASTAELTAVQSGISDMEYSAIDEKVGKRLEGLPEIQYAAGANMAFVSLPGAPIFLITGYAPLSPQWERYHLRRGSLPQTSTQMALGWRGAESLRKGVGDTLRVLGGQYRIVGVYETGTGYEDAGAVMTLREVQRRTSKPRQVMFYEIKLADPDQIDAVLARLEREFPELSVSRSAEWVENLPDMQTAGGMMNAIQGLTLLVGTVVVMNTMAMSVHERTREIGVLRALGWRRTQILGLIVSESLLLTLVGGAVGVGAAILLLRGLALIPGLSVIGSMMEFTPEVVRRVAALCVGLGLLGGIYPAWRASTLQPVEALRYE